MTDTPHDTPQHEPPSADDVAAEVATNGESPQEQTDAAERSESKKPWWKIWS